MLACFLLLLEEQWDFDNNEDKSMTSNATSHLNILDLEADHDAYISSPKNACGLASLAKDLGR